MRCFLPGTSPSFPALYFLPLPIPHLAGQPLLLSHSCPKSRAVALTWLLLIKNKPFSWSLFCTAWSSFPSTRPSYSIGNRRQNKQFLPQEIQIHSLQVLMHSSAGWQFLPPIHISSFWRDIRRRKQKMTRLSEKTRWACWIICSTKTLQVKCRKFSVVCSTVSKPTIALVINCLPFFLFLNNKLIAVIGNRFYLISHFWTPILIGDTM